MQTPLRRDASGQYVVLRVATLYYIGGVNTTSRPALTDTVLWLAMQRTAHNGKACREYTLADETGAPVLTGRAFNWARNIELYAPGGVPMLLLRRARLFALSGRVAVLELPGGRRLGTVRRNGRFDDAAGRTLGRFRDARSARARAGAGMAEAVFDVLAGADGTSVPGGPNSFVLEVAGGRAGALTSATLPYPAETDRAATTRIAQFVGRLLPASTLRALRALAAPSGWRFERSPDIPGDPRLQIAAALFAVEISRW